MAVNNCDVTVLMPVFNGERYLRDAMDSIFRQTFTNFEFLVIDDGSTDGSAAIIRSYNDPRLRVITNVSNVGQPTSLNRGLEQARGKYIARMDCDDVSLPERLAHQVRFLEEHPDHGVVGCDFEVIDERGRSQYAVEFSGEHSFLCWYLIFQNPLVHSATMIRRDLLKQVGGYDAAFEFAEDYELWLRICPLAKLSVVPQKLFWLRYHDGSLTQRHPQAQRKHAADARRIMIPRLLGQSVGEMEKYFREDTWNTLVCVDLIDELYQHTMRDQLSPTERTMIARDAAARLAVFFLRYPFQAKAWSALFSALGKDPLVFCRMLGWPVSRLLFRNVTNPVVLGR